MKSLPYLFWTLLDDGRTPHGDLVPDFLRRRKDTRDRRAFQYSALTQSNIFVASKPGRLRFKQLAVPRLNKT